MIAIFLTPIYLFFNYYILLWLYSWTDSFFPGGRSLLFRIPVTFLYAFFSVSPLTGLIITRKPFHHGLRIAANYWLGTLQYTLLVILLFDAIRRITGHFLFIKYKYPALLVFGSFAFFLILAVSFYGIVHAKQIKIRQYPVTIRKSCSVPKLKIALIADLHLGCNSTEAHIKKLVDAVNAQSPDLVCIAGDFFDNEYDAVKNPETMAKLLAGIQSLHGVYGCWGNHDVSEKILAGFAFPHKEKLDKDPRFEQFLSDANITLLEDETLCIDGVFYLAGRKDPDMVKREHDTRLSASDLLSGLDSRFPIIVMDHQPGELAAAAQAGVDLLLSGHTHDGQTFPATIPVRFLWENPGGILKKGAMTSVVTSGAGVWGPAMRVGTDNEIVILDVNFQSP